MTSVPVMSEGIRSGVNWMRLKRRSKDCASVLTTVDGQMSLLPSRKVQASALSRPCKPSSASLQSTATVWRICQASSLKSPRNVPITTLGAFCSVSARQRQLSASVIPLSELRAATGASLRACRRSSQARASPRPVTDLAAARQRS